MWCLYIDCFSSRTLQTDCAARVSACPLMKKDSSTTYGVSIVTDRFPSRTLETGCAAMVSACTLKKHYSISQRMSNVPLVFHRCTESLHILRLVLLQSISGQKYPSNIEPSNRPWHILEWMVSPTTLCSCCRLTLHR
jgi:hypothetical protein